MPHIHCYPGPPFAELRASGSKSRTHSCLAASGVRGPEQWVYFGESPIPASDFRCVPFDWLHQWRGLDHDFILYFSHGLAFPRTTHSFLWELELITCNFFQATELCWWIMAWKVHSGRLQTASHSSLLVSCRNLASHIFWQFIFPFISVDSRHYLPCAEKGFVMLEWSQTIDGLNQHFSFFFLSFFLNEKVNFLEKQGFLHDTDGMQSLREKQYCCDIIQKQMEG